MEKVVDLSRKFPGDSKMTYRMRYFDLYRTVFGSPDTWPENLRVITASVP
jgi:hypothetical protein